MLKRFLRYGLKLRIGKMRLLFWDVIDGEDVELIGEGCFDEIFKMCFFC